MDNYKDFLKNDINLRNEKLILFGAGVVGKIALCILKGENINVDYFCDNNEIYHGENIDGIKILNPEELHNFDPETNFFIASSYIKSVTKQLKDYNFKNIYNCINLFKNVDINKIDINNLSESFTDSHKFRSVTQFDANNWEISRAIELHKLSVKEDLNVNDINSLDFKTLDVVVTEKCSLKCVDCSNLMQYYEKPENCDTNLLVESVQLFLQCVDQISELRIIGGDPFMNKDLHKIINKLLLMDKAKKIIVYTNVTILPKGENLNCLMNDKVLVQMTNYGLELSRAHDQAVELFNENNIDYISNRVTKWQDCGKINRNNESVDELKLKFSDCCARDIITLLHGRLYRCPFSANGINLNAIPDDNSTYVDLDPIKEINELKKEIKGFYYGLDYISACGFCNGRDYGSAEVDAAVQTKIPIDYQKIENIN